MKKNSASLSFQICIFFIQRNTYPIAGNFERKYNILANYTSHLNLSILAHLSLGEIQKIQMVLKREFSLRFLNPLAKVVSLVVADKATKSMMTLPGSQVIV